MTLERTTTEDPRSLGAPADDGPPAGRREISTREIITSFGYQRFTNRELSRLDFAARLLDLAEDDKLALLERVKFMAIFAQLMDEFFQVRVAGLQDKVVAGVRTRSVDGLRPGEQLKVIRARAEELVARQDRIFLDRLVPALGTAGVRLSDWSSLDDDDRTYLVDVFDRQIFPVLTPLAVDPGHPFPYISNLSLNLLVEVGDRATGEQRIARVKVPPVLPRFVVMPDGERFVPLEQVIAAHLDTLFPGMTIGEHDAFRVTRNADLALGEDEADDLLVAVEMELRRRRFGSAVRLEINAGASPELRERLAAELEVPSDGVYVVDVPLDLGGLWAVYSLDRPDLHEETWTPMTPPHLATAGNEPMDLFEVLRERDVLLHHPYDSFATSVEAFVAQAAEDPDVLGIKQTLYRTSGDSPIVASLIRAAEAGKQVAAIVELKARFDEQANIGWARALEEAGVHVVYGLVGLKTHSKTVLVLRREEDGIRRYCHVGTGNYNPKTASIYEDLSLLTSDPGIGADVGDLFNYLTGFSRHAGYREILVRAGHAAAPGARDDRRAGRGWSGRPDRPEGQRAHRPGDDRRAVRRVVCRCPDRPGRPRPLLPATGHPRALREHPCPVDRRRVPRALPDLPVRRVEGRRAARRRERPRPATAGPADRVGRPDGAQPRPPHRGARTGPRRRAPGSTVRDPRPRLHRRHELVDARLGPAVATGADDAGHRLAAAAEGARRRAGPPASGGRSPAGRAPLVRRPAGRRLGRPAAQVSGVGAGAAPRPPEVPLGRR